jgi:hypothetical protein
LAEFFWKIFKPTKYYPEDPNTLTKLNVSTKALYDEINEKNVGVATFPKTYKTFGSYIKLSLPFYLLVLLGKQRSRIAWFSHWQRCIVISNLYDKLNDTIQHFLLFLRYQSDSPSHYEQLLPPNPLFVLLNCLNLSPEIAYQIVRLSYKPVYRLTEGEWDLMVLTYKKSFEEVVYEDTYKERAVADEWNLNGMVKDCRTNIWAGMSPELYTLFWALEPKQLTVPKETYQIQMEEMHKEIKKLEDDTANQGKAKHDKEIDKIRRNIDILKQEMNSQTKEKEKMDKFLMDNKEKITENFNEVKKRPIEFLQYCL